MKVKTNLSKRFLLITFLIGFLFLNINISYAQTSICEPCPQLAGYIASPNKTDYFIKKTGYKPPTQLKSQWKTFPALRKIEIAYEAFENKGNGEKFLSKLSSEIHKTNGAIGYETKLKSLIDLNYQDNLKYKHSAKYQKTSLPRSIRKQVMVISKYTEAGAFGGVRGVLQHKLGLSEDNVYKILRESTSFTDAFKKGLDQAGIPPSKKQRIVNLTKDLMKKYPSAEYDKNLIQFLEKQKKADDYLKNLCNKSRWEKIRKDFYRRINTDNLGYKSHQIKHFRVVLDDWNNYKDNNKIKWLKNNVIDIEKEFYNYSKSRSKVKACWGFIIQKQDFDGAINYYTNIAIDPKAKGNPYYLLKYYYNTTGNGNKFKNLYDKRTDLWVGKICN
ncbi:hypothetical protein [Tenacibaculum aiptasiae]|uniref:hypothetical protein n=1 Tax=Tenacibaculum aiptasiae TaxID=426481 RepID=UPI00232EB1E3|nr:hypothetical protein [Tenacibaculum aiptasiae]